MQMRNPYDLCAVIDACGRSRVSLSQILSVASAYFGDREECDRLYLYDQVMFLEAAGCIEEETLLGKRGSSYRLTRAGDEAAVRVIAALSYDDLEKLIRLGEGATISK